MRLILSLIIFLLPLQAGAVEVLPGTCSSVHASSVPSKAMTPTVFGKSLVIERDRSHMLKTGCKPCTACVNPISALPEKNDLLSEQEQQDIYPATVVQFCLQDFPQALLRPPRLG